MRHTYYLLIRNPFTRYNLKWRKSNRKKINNILYPWSFLKKADMNAVYDSRFPKSDFIQTHRISEIFLKWITASNQIPTVIFLCKKSREIEFSLETPNILLDKNNFLHIKPSAFCSTCVNRWTTIYFIWSYLCL